MILAKIHHWDIRPEGWIHWFQGGFDVPRGPLGVMCYLVFVPLFWLVPRRWRATYLVATSLLVTVATVGPVFTISLAALALGSFAVIRVWGTPRRHPLAIGVLFAAYGGMIYCPQPPWLPPVHGEQIYFYLHWAGIAYLLLRTLHVLSDVTRRKTAPPSLQSWLAYCLFAPAVRMGPIHRYDDFTKQLDGDLSEHRQLGYGVSRMFSGIIRLIILGILLDKFPLQQLFQTTWQLPVHRFVLGIYLAPMCSYLWISGYAELSIGVARCMGIVLPENFNYPWISVNIAEFWQRWHITLGAWLRDYIFNPLVRRRWHYFWAFIITFTFCGVWHGGWSWTIAGAAQGFGLGVMRLWAQTWKHQKNRQTSLYRGLARLGLVETGLNSFLSWLLTFHYEIACFMVVMDVSYSGKYVGLRLIEMLTGYPMH